MTDMHDLDGAMFMLQEPGDAEPWGLARIGPELGVFQLWTWLEGWIDANGQLETYFVRLNPGAIRVDDRAARDLMRNPRIGAYGPAEIAYLRDSPA